MATRGPQDQSLLSDLVERRVESRDVEYKNWMPLEDNIERANIARHICALANGGGGWLVFGFDDDGKPSEPYPDSLDVYGQDAINGIGERFLEPQPHCTVHRVTAAAGSVYPVVEVPSHGVTPVCARRDGPQNSKGQPQGIRSGVHYIRVAGPQSVPIQSPEQWRDLLRRCVFAERTSLLSSISQLFDRPQGVSPTAQIPQVEGGPADPSQAASSPLGDLSAFADEAVKAWDQLECHWPVDIQANRSLFAFRLLDASGDTPDVVPLDQLRRNIQNASFASREIVKNGAAFDAGFDADTRARVVLIDGRDAYQAQDLPTHERPYNLPLLWRIGPEGRGIEITAIPEDNPWATEAVEERSSRKWPAGRYLAPTFQVDTLIQRIGFVHHLAQSFPSAARCELMVDYVGLAGRSIGEPAPGVSFSIERSSIENARQVRVSWGVAALGAELPDVVSSLIGPIFRLFDTWDVGPDFVRSRLQNR